MRTLGIDNNFLALENQHSNFEDSEVVILPVPYEYTVSYGEGTEKGPAAIINASHFVEFYDEEFDNELCIEKGIATLDFMDFKNIEDSVALELIREKVQSLLEKDKFVVTIGGEHTISQSPIRPYFDKYPDMSILHFDAHSDFRNEYEGTPLSHACVMARVAEFFPPGRITQVGIRAQCKEEAEFIKKNKVKTFYASSIRKGEHGPHWQKKICDSLGDKIYVTFDVDYFDPSIMPATGTPEPDGFLYGETLDVFREIRRSGRKMIGFDVVELAPIGGLSHPDMTAASLIYKLLNFALA